MNINVAEEIMVLATSRFCNGSSVRIVESIYQPLENKTQASEIEREKYRTPAAKKNVTYDTSQKEWHERRRGIDEGRTMKREREKGIARKREREVKREQRA